jgi:hypothetical protein
MRIQKKQVADNMFWIQCFSLAYWDAVTTVLSSCAALCILGTVYCYVIIKICNSSILPPNSQVPLKSISLPNHPVPSSGNHTNHTVGSLSLSLSLSLFPPHPTPRTWIWTQSVAPARQVLYHLSHALAPCFRQGLPLWSRAASDLDPPTSASLVAGITGMWHHAQPIDSLLISSST